MKGSWSPCTIMGKGKARDHYYIRVKMAKPPGYLDVPEVGAAVLRKAYQAAPHLDNATLYEAGEVAMVQVAGRPQAGTWVKCVVLGKGRPGTYDIRVVSNTPEGHTDLRSIPVKGLRKLEATEMKYPSYEAGKIMEVRVASGAYAGKWIRCAIISRGDIPDTYHIGIWGLANSHIPNIPVQALREVPEQHPQPTSEGLAALRAHLASYQASSMPIFEANETAEVESPEGWIRCTIAKRGSQPNTYTVRVLANNTDGYVEVPDIPAHKLRKAASVSTSQMVMWSLRVLFGPR
uniref:Uncharacterized protein n=1 Tax=Pyrodinium bahamense TaxID=73915 RepID=A0A7R9ZVG6_9DINO